MKEAMKADKFDALSGYDGWERMRKSSSIGLAIIVVREKIQASREMRKNIARVMT
jgi:hypothetical protein